jgi:uncharacterized protein with FMN-binding domain
MMRDRLPTAGRAGNFWQRGTFSALSTSLEDTKMKKLLISVTIAAFAVTGAYAQTAGFYVVRDATTKKCTIVDQKPTTTTTTVVGDGVYKTRTEAETGMKSVKVCTEN